VRTKWQLLFGVALMVTSASAVIASERESVGPITVANAPMADTPEPSLNSPIVERPTDPATSKQQSSETTSDNAVVVVVLGGDLGFGGSNQSVDPTGAFRHGRKEVWQVLTDGIASVFDGDINFANLETVVTDSNDLRANPKSFNFKSHPAAINHIARLGLNVVSTANNHAVDYGDAGLRETLRHLEGAAAHGLAAWPGIGIGREQASRPADVTVNGARVRISAIGIGGGGMPEGEASGSRKGAGMLNYNRAEDFSETVARLADAQGDLRILSVHYGAELQVRASLSDAAKLRDQAAKGSGIDIVVGHHAHVAAGVQRVDGKLVLYGLGNLLHPGMQDMAQLGICRDYGLVIRVLFSRDAAGKLTPGAIEAVPLTQMHARATPLKGDAGRLRIEVLNHLAAELDDAKVGATGIRFASQADGTGLYCLPDAAKAPGRIGAACKSWEPPAAPSADVSRRIAGSCGNTLVARSRNGPGDGAKAQPERPDLTRQKSKDEADSALLTSIFGL